MNNWWTATSPESPFVPGFLIARRWADGRRLILPNWDDLTLLERTPQGTVARSPTPDEIPALLAERFEPAGFELGADGRLARRR